VDLEGQEDVKAAVDHGVKHEGHRVHGDTPEIHLSRHQLETLAIEIERLVPRYVTDSLKAPGEVHLNAYATAKVTPRIPAQVMARHARLGESVQAGQPLATLSSVEMSHAQGELLVAEREWQRVRRLGEKVVSERRYIEARVKRQQGRARVTAYGMQPAQVDALLRAGSEQADGSFQLLARHAGTVIGDDFILGELVEPGRVLFQITDEYLRWVEARLPPGEAAQVKIGDVARIHDGDNWLDGMVIQRHHALDQNTRTQAVRIQVPDPDHRLHPGVFVDVTLFKRRGDPVLAVPEAAVLRGPDGVWQVFVRGDEEGAFMPREVEPIRSVGGLTVIQGLPEGAEVVVQGAFFLQSELAKSDFDVHQH
jgi:RND family efflux transporter MFP subunit